MELCHTTKRPNFGTAPATISVSSSYLGKECNLISQTQIEFKKKHITKFQISDTKLSNITSL